jgi:hypothetical protein
LQREIAAAAPTLVPQQFRYELRVQDTSCAEFGSSERTLIVTEAAPVPTKLGSLEQRMGSQSCDQAPRFDLLLDSATLPYASLLEISVSVDQGEPFVWMPFGSLGDQNEHFELDRCSSVDDRECVPSSTVHLEVHTRVAGEVEELLPLQLDVDASCKPPAPLEPLCSYSRGASGSPSGGYATRLLGLALLSAFWFQRRRRRACQGSERPA